MLYAQLKLFVMEYVTTKQWKRVGMLLEGHGLFLAANERLQQKSYFQGQPGVIDGTEYGARLLRWMETSPREEEKKEKYLTPNNLSMLWDLLREAGVDERDMGRRMYEKWSQEFGGEGEKEEEEGKGKGKVGRK